MLFFAKLTPDSEKKPLQNLLAGVKLYKYCDLSYNVLDEINLFTQRFKGLDTSVARLDQAKG